MLTFELYRDGPDEPGRAHVDPAAVASVLETERRSYGRGAAQVAVVTMTSGKEFVVIDYSRTVAKQIAEAKAGKRA